MPQSKKIENIKTIGVSLESKGIFPKKKFLLTYDETADNFAILIQKKNGVVISNEVNEQLKETLVFLFEKLFK